MIQVIHTPLGEPLGQIISEIPHEKSHFTKPLHELEETQRILVSFNSRPLSAPIECKKLIPEASVHPGSAISQISVKYYKKPNISPLHKKSPEHINLSSSPKPKISNKKLEKSPAKSVPRPLIKPKEVPSKEKLIKISSAKPKNSKENQKTVKPEKAQEQPQPKKEEKPKADPEKLKLILKESISKHREQKIKEQELEMIEEEKIKQKEKEIREFSEEAKEKLEKSKKIPFKPKTAWGADQRKFQEQDEKFKEEAKKEKEKKKEAREKVRQEGRARIGLKELFEAKPELEEKIRNKSKGNDEKNTKKPPKQPNEEIQAYMAEQKRLRKLRLEEEKRKKEEENRLRIAKLKELDEMSRSRANVSKRSDSNPDLERRMRIIRKARSAAKRMKNGGSADFSYEEEKFEKNSEEPSDFMQQKYTDEDIFKGENYFWKNTKKNIYNEPNKESGDEKPSEKDIKSEKESEESKESEENEKYEDEYTSEEKFSVEEKVPVKDTNSEINFSQDLKIEKDNLPGNYQEVKPSYQDYVINPNAIDNLSSKTPDDDLKLIKKELEFFKSEQISITQAVSNKRNPQDTDVNKRKEHLRTQLADLQTRLEKIVKQKNEAPVKDEAKIEDDLDIEFPVIPGILNIQNCYAEAQEFDEFIQFKAARKIQALVRGYLTRKDFQKKKLGIKSQKEINSDIHSILNKYYPEAYIPEDTIISSYIPESMSYPATSINPTLSSNLRSISMKPEQEPIKIVEESDEKPQLKLQNFLKNDFNDNDEYNLVNILAKELYLVEKIEEKEIDIEEEPEASIHTSEEQYSSEFESEEEIKSKRSEEEPARSSRIKFSDDYRLSSSKYGIHESIYESDENSDIPESIYESKTSKKALISSFKGSKSEISESIYESKGISSRRLEDSGKKYTTSSIPEDIIESKGISSRRVDSLADSSKKFASSISEDIIESKKSLASDIPEDIYESKKTLNSYISEEIESSSGKNNKFKQSQSSDHYSEDFESVSSSHEALVKRFESPQNIQETYEDDFESASKTDLASSLKNDFQKKIEEIPAPGKFSAKQLQDQLVSQIEAFDRTKNRELEAEMMVKAHRQWMEDKKKEEMMMIMKAQELYIEELKKSKQEDHDRFQQLAQFIANQQKESFSDLAAVIRQALINVPRPRTPSKKSDTSEIDYIEERKSPLRPDDYIRTDYSEDFESYSDSSKQYGLKNSGRVQSPDYSKKYIEQQIKEEADRSRFSSSSSLTRSLSPQIKITPRDKLKNSDDFRASSSSIPEDIDVMGSYKSSDFIEESAALKNFASSHEVSKSIETEISKKEESIDESLPQYSDDFESLSKSKQTLNEYSSDFESASQSIHPTISSKVLTQSIKEESPGHSETEKSNEESEYEKSKEKSELPEEGSELSEEGSELSEEGSVISEEESIQESIDNYEDDFESESSSVLKSSRDKLESSSSGAKSSSVAPEESSESKKSSSVEEKNLEESENKVSVIEESIEEVSEDIQSYEKSLDEYKSKEESKENEDLSNSSVESIENHADEITNEIFASIFAEILENLPSFNVDELVNDLFHRVLQEVLETLPVSDSSSPQISPAVNTDTNSVLGYTSIILGSAHNFTLNPFTKDSIETLAMLRESNYIDHALMNPEQLLPIDLYMQLEEEKQDDGDNAKIQAQQIHNKMIFDAVNEALNRLRPHGRKGSPLPWSNVARINKTVAVGDLKNQVEGLVNSWAEIKYGPKQEQPVLNEMEEKKKGATKDVDNSLKLLNSDIVDEDEEWVDYEDAETKVKIELEQFIFDQLIEETEYILSSM